MADKLDYTSVISDLRAKIAALQAVLASFESAAALGALGQPIEGTDPSLSPAIATRNDTLGIPSDLPEGAFMGKSVPACVELYLSAVKKKKTNKEIAAALRDGGVESNANNFENVVTGTLFNLKQAGKVLRFKDGWGLAEWYPAHIRAAAPNGSAKRSKGKVKKAGNKAKAKVSGVKDISEHKGTSNQVPKKKKGETAERIDRVLRSKPEAEFSAQQVAQEINLNVQVAHMILANLVKQGKADKTPSGNYRAPAVKSQAAHPSVM